MPGKDPMSPPNYQLMEIAAEVTHFISVPINAEEVHLNAVKYRVCAMGVASMIHIQECGARVCVGRYVRMYVRTYVCTYVCMCV